MKTKVMYLVALLSVLLFSSCEPKNPPVIDDEITNRFSQYIDLAYSSMGQPSSVFLEKAKDLGLEVKDESELYKKYNDEYYRIGDYFSVAYNNDSMCAAVLKYDFFNTYSYGIELYTDLSNQIFNYGGWDIWGLSVPTFIREEYKLSWTEGDMSKRAELINLMIDKVAHCTEPGISTSEDFQIKIGDVYLFVVISYLGNSANKETGNPIELNEKVPSEIRCVFEIHTDPVRY